MKRLNTKLREIDGKGYRAYKDIKGRYNFNDYILEIIKVQGDPFASPSLLKVEIDLKKYGYNSEMYSNISKKVAFEDYVSRVFEKAIWKEAKGKRGTGKSGAIFIYRNGQEILKRSSVEIENDILQIRFYMGLPAAGRRVLSKEAKEMIFVELPNVVKYLKKEKVGYENLTKHIKVNERSDYIREEIKKRKLVAFIANESILPRESGVSEKPLKNAIKFMSPKEFEIELELQNGDKIKGMGIKEGITIITGGGFHGKSTLLDAIEKGIYNHIPNDGREMVITNYNAVKIRAEDGRGISGVDITPFINNLPYGKSTENFYTENASGSTSQAANIIESMELGAELLLIDEDTSATNFMMRDVKIQEIIKKEKEPITPFVERIQAMYEKSGISTIVVVGGLGDYFDIADTVLMLDEYKVKDITKEAKAVIEKYKDYSITKEILDEEVKVRNRYLDIKNIGKIIEKKDKIKSRDLDEIIIGTEEVDLRYLEQLVEKGQVEFIGNVIKYIINKNSGKLLLKDILQKIEEEINSQNITKFLKYESGNMVFARRFEIGATINRIRKRIF
ncbi:ABC-ATPase domain-containing protein [Haliovirga abyssi]|uniref:ATPase n=1 Tax=Haliovirga abyssi TaxID=2996794 RepID=A0AAU9DEY5_9FUSO|nr:ABC-ATPase domain-containing protein [Haliovirga abyssi]BDU50957.1 ATPase [Haliovirga abyssi]